MRKTRVWNLLLVLSLTVFCAGCGKSVVGVYQLKWQGDWEGHKDENSRTYDFRADGTCLYTPYVTSHGNGTIYIDNEPVQGTWAVEDGKVAMKCNGTVFATFTREGSDLIGSPSSTRFIKIR